MATVEDLSSRHENYLLRVQPAGNGVCKICHTFVTDDFETCYQCHQALGQLPFVATVVTFVALAVKHEQLARELWTYKSDRLAANRTQACLGLAAVLWRWLDGHERCIARSAGVKQFPVVTTVPSTRGRTDHPLESMVGKIVQPTSSRYRRLLRTTNVSAGDRSYCVDQFEPLGPVPTGAPVLLIDDTWTTGAHAQSAAAALQASGTGPVAVACIGRHFAVPSEPRFRKTAELYLQRARRRGWSWERCCLCEG